MRRAVIQHSTEMSTKAAECISYGHFRSGSVGFFLPGTENLQIFRENGTEEQSFCTMFFFSSSDIGKDFPVAEDFSKNPAAVRYQLQSNLSSGIHKSGIINLCIETCIIKCSQ